MNKVENTVAKDEIAHDVVTKQQYFQKSSAAEQISDSFCMWERVKSWPESLNIFQISHNTVNCINFHFYHIIIITSVQQKIPEGVYFA